MLFLKHEKVVPFRARYSYKDSYGNFPDCTYLCPLVVFDCRRHSSEIIREAIFLAFKSMRSYTIFVKQLPSRRTSELRVSIIYNLELFQRS